MHSASSIASVWAGLIGLGLLSGCASLGTDPASSAPVALAPEADRAAILAMAGDYSVTFQFNETVALDAEYSLWDPYASAATETVRVLEERPDFISLQHILVMGAEGRVVKHWRQDWQYQPQTVYRYIGPVHGRQTWVPEALSPEQSRGAWVQTVWQVDDSPRYQSIGRWQHEGAVSDWMGDRAGRPLPRREWTKRDDYQLMLATHRHTLTPTGWVHEQDNLKRILEPQGVELVKDLTRETGLNRYKRIQGYDFGPGTEYWERTQLFWADVRAWWAERMDGEQLVQVQVQIGETTLWGRLFALAAEVGTEAAPDAAAWRPKMEAILNDHARFVPDLAAARAQPLQVAAP